MSEQNNANTKPVLEDVIRYNLTGKTLQNALDFVAHLRTGDESRNFKGQQHSQNLLTYMRYGSKGGADTMDSIFLLSFEKACTYFGNSRSKLLNRGKIRHIGLKEKMKTTVSE